MQETSQLPVDRTVGPKGRYRLARPIAAGPSTTLWAGIDTVTGEALTVEVLRALPPLDVGDAKSLSNRLAAAQDLPLHEHLLPVRSIYVPESPRIPPVARRLLGAARGGGPDAGRWLLLLDPFDGWTLEERVASGRASARDVLIAAVKAGEALGALHAVGLSHGSLGPASILIDEGGAVRVVDAYVSSWWRSGPEPDRDPRGEDVLALATVVTQLLPADEVPADVRRVAEAGSGAAPPVDDLVEVLRSAAERAPTTSIGPTRSVEDAEGPIALGERRVPAGSEPSANVRAAAHVDEPAEREARHGAAATARRAEQDRRKAEEARALRDLGVVSDEVPPTERAAVEPLAVGRSDAGSSPEARGETSVEPAPEREEPPRNWAFSPPEPAVWMQVVGVVASIVMIVALVALVVFALNQG